MTRSSRDWLRTSPRASLSKDVSLAREFASTLAPHTQDYVSDLPAVFLCELEGLGSLGNSGEWIVRDGLVPLLWFFKRFPSPKTFQGKLYIHFKLANIIPREWQKTCGVYRLRSSFSDKRKNLILIGTASRHFIGTNELEALLEPRSKVHSHSSFVLSIEPPRTPRSGDSFLTEFYQILFSSVGTNHAVKSFIDLRRSPEVAQHASLFELNARLVCADSYATHFLLSQGAHLFDDSSGWKKLADGKEVLSIPLSPFHEFQLIARVPRGVKVDARLREFRKLQPLTENVDWLIDNFEDPQLPWQSWLSFWTKAAR